MCFSAEASFAAAGALGVLGAAAFASRRVASPPLVAAAPTLFAIQQALEGAIWMQLRTGPPERLLVFAYLIFARCLWPVYAPFAVRASEPLSVRRRWMTAFLIAGVAMSGYLLWGLFAFPQAAVAVRGHVCYASGQPVSVWAAAPYALVILGPLFLSSIPVVRRFGALVALGGAISALAYFEAFQSVWCFFAAVASLILVFGPAWARRIAPSRVRSEEPAEGPAA